MKKQNKLIIPEESLINKIYLIRDRKIMLDRDLAVLYDVKARRLREQMRRNPDRFPENFMFQLTEEEVNFMVSQNAIPSKQVLGGSLPYAFTEHGILMLSSVLKSRKAIQMSIQIIEIFVRLRKMLMTQTNILVKVERIEQQLVDHGEDIHTLFDYVDELIKDKTSKEQQSTRKKIGFK